ncbi:MAG: 50S ribosomal protein L1 [Candidatus Saccharimonadales bacterium]|nr:50S ribosomal protein L1 [Candidatus Saccharimonadales bacterium]
MAKTKADWLKEAKALGLKMTEKNKNAEIKTAIEEAVPKKHDKAHDEKPAEEKTKVAKAGKRSAKAVREAEEEERRQEKAKQIREGEVEPAAPETKKGPIPVTRPKIERRGKKYREAAKKIDKTQKYQLKDGVVLATDSSTTKFDATVELHVRLNVDPTQADQNIRGVTTLPHGTGKTLRVAVFAPTEDHKAAEAAGADIVGEADFLEKLKKEELDFDVLISTPQFMSQLGRFAKLLGPKGLMPNPKSGTVTKAVAKAVKEAKTGKVEFRIDKQGIVHSGIGKHSFGADKLTDNALAMLSAIKSARPPSIKGIYVASISITTSMGPSVPIDPAVMSEIKT